MGLVKPGSRASKPTPVQSKIIIRSSENHFCANSLPGTTLQILLRIFDFFTNVDLRQIFTNVCSCIIRSKPPFILYLNKKIKEMVDFHPSQIIVYFNFLYSLLGAMNLIFVSQGKCLVQLWASVWCRFSIGCISFFVKKYLGFTAEPS